MDSVIRLTIGVLLVAANSLVQAAKGPDPSEAGCLEVHSKAWCLMAVKGFGTQLTDVPVAPADAPPAPATDLDGTRTVSQALQATSVVVDARAAAGLMSGVSRAMGAAGIVLDLLTYRDPGMPLRGFKLLVWMPRDFPHDDTPKVALEKLLVQAMVRGSGSTGVEAVDFKHEALFKTDIEHFYKLVGEGKYQGQHFNSRLWQYNKGLSWSEERAPEYLGGSDAYTFDIDIVPRFSTVEKRPALRYDMAVVIAMSQALPPWVIVYVPPLNNRNPYLLQQGNVLPFEIPPPGKAP